MLKNSTLILGALFMSAILFSTKADAQKKMQLTLNVDKQGAAVSPDLYGLMTEEINYSYDGGLYAELIRNRNFKDNERTPDYWSTVSMDSNSSSISLDYKQPINSALNVCLKWVVQKADRPVGIANTGYWGIAVKAEQVYSGSLFIKSSDGGAPLTLSIETNDGKTIFASTEISQISSDWKRYQFSLRTGAGIPSTKDARFVIRTAKTGTYYLNLVSLFPPTYKNTPNGNRSDIMELLAAMRPKFLRLPGGNYLEGEKFSDRFDWKQTLGDISKRPGHMSPWHYRSTDGMGLLEYLRWCEDLNMDPVLALFAGYTLNRDYLPAGPLLQPFVDEALEEIEYVTGDSTTKWGKQRALDGHPAPFALKYVEIGNEDGFDRSGSYDGRFTQFFHAIREKYPNLQVISTTGGLDPLGSRFPVHSVRPDVFDEHYYRSASEMEADANHYDNYDRKGPKIFVGEWATREGSPTPNFNAALGDAAWMTGMERNSDIVVMSCYAPLFVNVNPGGMQWKSDLIGYNALSSYGSPSYYAQVLFSNHVGDRVIPIDAVNVPTQLESLNQKQKDAGAQAKTIPAVFYVATRDNKNGLIYLKLVNTLNTDETIQISLKGIKVNPKGELNVLKAMNPNDTNTIDNPKNIIPVKSEVSGFGTSFNRTLPAYSISVFTLHIK